MKIQITVTQLFKTVGAGPMAYILNYDQPRTMSNISDYDVLYPNRVSTKLNYMHMPKRKMEVLKPLCNSLRYLKEMKDDIVLELTTEEFDALMFFKCDEQ